ncbi:MAG: 50S ribosomal protein L10 [Nanoarchaeota archaeon]|nr:50S ribosomal protein L10 [Nanoarchaeota archaeon]
MVGRESVSQAKIEQTLDLTKNINEKKIIAIFDVTGMPAAALQKIKYELYGTADLKSVKKSMLLKAVDASEKNSLKEYVVGQPGIIFTTMNPFKLYKVIQKSKTNVTAKAGDIAPNDIEVKAGPTELMPGPAISTLSKAGLQSKVEGGKIAVLKDKVVAKAGDKITAELASVLSMLKIEPMEVGLNLKAVYEDGVIYTSDILSIDEEQVLNDMVSGYHRAINLSIESGFITKEAVPIMITKAFNEARSLALEAGIVSKDIIGEILAKAVAEMKSVEDKVGPIKVEETKEEVVSENTEVKE